MDPLQLLILLVIAGICGAVAELIVGFSPPGLHVMLVSIIIGVIGAFIGAWIASVLNLPPITEIRVGTIRLNLLYTIIGSTLLLVLLQALQRQTMAVDQQEVNNAAEKGYVAAGRHTRKTT